MRWTGWVLMAAAIAVAGSAAGSQPGCASCNGGMTIGPWDAEPCAGRRAIAWCPVAAKTTAIAATTPGPAIASTGQGSTRFGPASACPARVPADGLAGRRRRFPARPCALSDSSHAADAGASFPECYPARVPNPVKLSFDIGKEFERPAGRSAAGAVRSHRREPSDSALPVPRAADRPAENGEAARSPTCPACQNPCRRERYRPISAR